MKKKLFILAAFCACLICGLTSCEKEKTPAGNEENTIGDFDETLSSLTNTYWKYVQIDTMDVSDGSLGLLIDTMSFNFTTATEGFFGMNYSLMAGDVTEVVDAETYPMTYTYDADSKKGNISVSGLYSFNMEVIDNQNMDVRIATSNPMRFVRVK